MSHDLRSRAEHRARESFADPRAADRLSPEESRLLHDLRVHQIELEMQNEELRRTEANLETSRARYFDLYDLAPVGYLTVNDAGLVVDLVVVEVDLGREGGGGEGPDAVGVLGEGDGLGEAFDAEEDGGQRQ